MGNDIALDGSSLTLEDVIEVVYENKPVILSEKGNRNIEKAHRRVQKILESGDVVYGVNTGFGALSAVRIPDKKVRDLQYNLIRSHSCGTGEPFPPHMVKAMMLILANGLAKGHSGCRTVIVQTLIDMINKNLTPVVPSQGRAVYHGRELSGRAALRQAGIAPVSLEAKEGLSLINGTYVMSAVGGLAHLQSENLARIADIAAAMTLEVTKGTSTAVRPEIQEARRHPGHKSTAANILKLVAGSGIMDSHKDCGRVQDAYSLRCVPQVHGAVKDALAYCRNTLEIEINSTTDNPLIFGDDVISAGNFHGQPLAIAFDTLGIAVTDLGNIAERRIERLMNPSLSGLPAFLSPDPGLNSGYMMSHYLASGIALENTGLAAPGSVASNPVSANKEDYVSNGMWCARKAAKIAENTEKILAVELMCAVQAFEFVEGLKSGAGTTAACKTIREVVPKLKRDRIIQKDLLAVLGLIQDGTLIMNVEAAAGQLSC